MASSSGFNGATASSVTSSTASTTPSPYHVLPPICAGVPRAQYLQYQLAHAQQQSANLKRTLELLRDLNRRHRHRDDDVEDDIVTELKQEKTYLGRRKRSSGNVYTALETLVTTRVGKKAEAREKRQREIQELLAKQLEREQKRKERLEKGHAEIDNGEAMLAFMKDMLGPEDDGSNPPKLRPPHEYKVRRFHWCSRTKKVTYKDRPNARLELGQHVFGRGTFRAAYRAKLQGESGLVIAKRPIRVSEPKEVFQSYTSDIRELCIAEYFAAEFNKARPSDVPKVTYCWVQVLSPINPKQAKTPPLIVEPMLKGKWEKYNNNGTVGNMYLVEEAHLAQAFSHFTYVHSKKAKGGEMMVLDVQGVKHADGSLHLTDPVIVTVKRGVLGDANTGVEGMKGFFSRHKCNAICRKLNLQGVRLSPL
eukprot:m.123230 g.123230  ORF g.123230 m.123230 type:complete len:421 (-) comp15675_c1_seq4:619-1881(-)